MQGIFLKPLPEGGESLVNPLREALIVSPFRPLRTSPWDAGIDLPARTSVSLSHAAETLIPTGVKVVIPPGVVGLVTRRSGFRGILIPNAPCVIDPGYRGELEVPAILLGDRESPLIPEGFRFAQLVLIPPPLTIWISSSLTLYEQLGEVFPTDRGERGYGSTGWASPRRDIEEA